MKKLMTALFISAALGMPFLAAAEAKGIDLVQAAHLTVEQKLEGTVHNQVVYAQNGLAIWDQIIEKESLAIHYPKIHLAGHGDEARRMNRYFRKRAKSSMKNYEKATLPDAKLTSHVNYLLSYHGDQFLSFREYGYDYFERAAHPTSWELGVTFYIETGRPVSWQEVLAAEGKKAYTLKEINRRLFASSYGKAHAFYYDFKGLTALPKNYYLDEKGTIHFVFGQYEIAPYSSGIIDLPMN